MQKKKKRIRHKLNKDMKSYPDQEVHSISKNILLNKITYWYINKQDKRQVFQISVMKKSVF